MRPIPCGRASLPACLVALAAGCSGDVGDDRSASAARRPPSKAEVDFETDAAGHAPTGFIFARTGSGAIGEWQVIHNQNEDDTPSGTKVLAQLSDDRTGRRYPVAIREGFAAKNVRVSVRIKPISGRKDQAGGIVLRYQDERAGEQRPVPSHEGRRPQARVRRQTRADRARRVAHARRRAGG